MMRTRGKQILCPEKNVQWRSQIAKIHRSDEGNGQQDDGLYHSQILFLSPWRFSTEQKKLKILVTISITQWSLRNGSNPSV